MDGWLTWDFTSFLTLFQSYPDDVWMIMKTVCNGTLFMIGKISASSRAGTWDLQHSRPALNILSHWAS